MCKERRMPLQEGQRLKLSFLKNGFEYEKEVLYESEVVIRKYLSSGSTCLVYEADIVDAQNHLDRRVILKEFYPSENGKGTLLEDRVDEEYYVRRLEDGTLDFPFVKYDDIKDSFHQFMKSYEKQKELSNDSELLEVIVKPYAMAATDKEYNYYILSEIHIGEALHQASIYQKGQNLEQKFRIMEGICEILYLLQRKGLMFTDIKPENLLCLKVLEEYRSNMYLFDVDSIISRKELLENPLSEIYVSKAYMSPILYSIAKNEMDFNNNRELFDQACIMYSFGLIIHEMLLGYLPENNILDLSKDHKRKHELMKLYGVKEREAEWIHELMLDLLPDTSETLISSFRENVANQPVNVLAKIRSISKNLSYQPQRSYVDATKSDYLFSCFDILDSYPVYEYADQNDKNGYDLKVAMIGAKNHITPYMLQALISCVQMLDSDLYIRIYDENARQVWRDFSEKNPEIKRAVTVNYNDRPMIKNYDKSLVEYKLCHIDLYEEYPNAEELVEELEREHIRYRLLLGEKEENESYFMAEKKAKASESVFIGYVEKMDAIVKDIQKQCVNIKTPGIENYFEMKILKSQIFKQAHFIDLFYSNGLGKEITAKQREEKKVALLNDRYNLESSERSALHMKYALASVGIMDITSIDVYKHLISKLLDPENPQSKKNFERLSQLEHLSWSAHMITTGVERLRLHEYEEIAFKNGNDWKIRENKLVVKHPFLVSREQGICLNDEAFEGEMQEDWDELDKISYKIYHMNFDMAEERRAYYEEIAEAFFDEIEEEATEEEMTYLEDLMDLYENFFEHGHFDHAAWDEISGKLKGILGHVDSEECKEYLAELNDYANLLKNAGQKRDIKKSDNDVLFAVFPLVAFVSYEKI